MVCYAKINVKMVEKMFIFYIGGAHSLNVRKYQWKINMNVIGTESFQKTI